MFVLKNAHLISALTEGYTEPEADLVIDGAYIKEINAPGRDYGELRTVDLARKTVIPGMIDLHTHLYFSTGNFPALGMQSHNDSWLSAILYGKEFLRQGFTTVRDVGNPYYIGVAIKKGVEAGAFVGPRMFVSGHCISPTTRGNNELPALYFEADSPEEISKACRVEYSEGVDFFKYMATGCVANMTGAPGELISSRDEIFALQAAAEARNTYAAVHAHGTEGIFLCAEAGIRTIEHASMIDDKCIEMILKKNCQSAIVPTLDPVVANHRLPDAVIPKPIMDKLHQIYLYLPNLVAATRAGILTGWGTDEHQDFYRSNIGCEFSCRSEAGYTNTEILEQATINSAKILGVDDKLGTIKAGKLADLVIIDGNPENDLSVMERYPNSVYKEGRLCAIGGVIQ